MFLHQQKLQYKSTPEAPDAVYARKLQEVIGGQYGEITVAMQYSFQAWNAHIPGKYRDLLFGTAAEEFGHIEMLATMVAQLLEKDPNADMQATVDSDPVNGKNGIVKTLGTARAWLDAGGTPRTPGTVVQECGAGLVPVLEGNTAYRTLAERHADIRICDFTDPVGTAAAIRTPPARGGPAQRTGNRSGRAGRRAPQGRTTTSQASRICSAVSTAWRVTPRGV